MNGYTKGPLRRVPCGGYSTIIAENKPDRCDNRIPAYGYYEANGHCIAYPFLNEDGSARVDFVCFGHEDAKRLVACWNAMTGIPDPAATMKEVREVLDRLVSNVQDWVDAIDNNGTGWDDWDEHYKNFAYHNGLARARALLAKLEGK